MSVSELLSLIVQRGGKVDPESCLQCATLRKKIRAADRSRDLRSAREVVLAMAVHKTYGHPEDGRSVGTDVSLRAPRVL